MSSLITLYFWSLGSKFCHIVYFTDRPKIALFALFCPKFLYLRIGNCYRLEIFTKVSNWYYKAACKISSRSECWLPWKWGFWVKYRLVCKIRTTWTTHLKFCTSSISTISTSGENFSSNGEIDPLFRWVTGVCFTDWSEKYQNVTKCYHVTNFFWILTCFVSKIKHLEWISSRNLKPITQNIWFWHISHSGL